MSITVRMLPSIAPTGQMNMSVNGRNYKAALGSFLDVPENDAATLAANGWVRVCLSGPTTARPSTNPNLTPPYVACNGMIFYDLTLSAPVVHDGANWRTFAGVVA
jgi:hypothetical protein